MVEIIVAPLLSTKSPLQGYAMNSNGVEFIYHLSAIREFAELACLEAFCWESPDQLDTDFARVQRDDG